LRIGHNIPTQADTFTDREDGQRADHTCRDASRPQTRDGTPGGREDRGPCSLAPRGRRWRQRRRFGAARRPATGGLTGGGSFPAACWFPQCAPLQHP
jgi:hypothetical protein